MVSKCFGFSFLFLPLCCLPLGSCSELHSTTKPLPQWANHKMSARCVWATWLNPDIGPLQQSPCYEQMMFQTLQELNWNLLKVALETKYHIPGSSCICFNDAVASASSLWLPDVLKSKTCRWSTGHWLLGSFNWPPDEMSVVQRGLWDWAVYSLSPKWAWSPIMMSNIRFHCN